MAASYNESACISSNIRGHPRSIIGALKVGLFVTCLVDLVRPGMDGRQVFELIDKPFERHDNDAIWIYSGPTNSASPYYHERKVLFTRDAKNIPRVQKVVKEFHAPSK